MVNKFKEKINVFILGRYLPEHNGAAIFFHRTAKFLTKKYDIKVNRICCNSKFKKNYIIDDIKVNSFSIPKFLYKFRITQYLYFTIVFIYKLAFNKFNSNVFHCITITWHTLIIIYLTKLIKRKKKIIIDHTQETDLRNDSFKSRLTLLIKVHILSKANIIRSPSPMLSKQLNNLSLNNYELYLPHIDFNLFKPIQNDELLKLKNKLKIPPKKMIILSVGRVCFRKGSDLIIKSFKKANNKRDFYLILLGPCDPEFKKYKNQQDIFISDEKVNNVYEFMKVADIFVLMSRVEGLGIVFIEALASGLKIIMPKINGVSDYIINNNQIGKEINYNIDSLKNEFYKLKKKIFSFLIKKYAEREL